MTAPADTITEDAPVHIADIQKNTRETIRVALKIYKRHPFADVRVHFRDDNGELKPSGKGIGIRPDLLPELIEALKGAEAEARRRGLL